ncbi:hypothetical protein G5C65_35590 [Streptomyces sp. SB3404]|uniref:Uncharacterized protein n=1 Tax=Streptomyces boncukensis TaxID=2711219 RepID=A0A6G4X8J0_9ACTN|nr:hypothetical protein [Streptomyces boncukensis]
MGHSQRRRSGVALLACAVLALPGPLALAATPPGEPSGDPPAPSVLGSADPQPPQPPLRPEAAVEGERPQDGRPGAGQRPARTPPDVGPDEIPAASKPPSDAPGDTGRPDEPSASPTAGEPTPARSTSESPSARPGQRGHHGHRHHGHGRSRACPPGAPHGSGSPDGPAARRGRPAAQEGDRQAGPPPRIRPPSPSLRPAPRVTDQAIGRHNLYEPDPPAPGQRSAREAGTDVAAEPSGEVLPVLPLGAGLALTGLGLAFLALRLRRG